MGQKGLNRYTYTLYRLHFQRSSAKTGQEKKYMCLHYYIVTVIFNEYDKYIIFLLLDENLTVNDQRSLRKFGKCQLAAT